MQRLLDVLDGADDDVTVGRRLEHMMSLELRDDVTGTYRRSHDDVIERYPLNADTILQIYRIMRYKMPEVVTPVETN